MNPYYQDDFVTLYNTDSTLFDESSFGFDLAVIDPPHDRWQELGRKCSIDNRILFLNFRNYLDVLNIHGKPKTEIIWHFPDGRWTSHNLPQFNHESIWIYGKPGHSYHGDLPQSRKTVCKGKGCVGSYRYDEKKYYTPRERKQLTSVLKYPKNMSNGFGVWAKPAELVQKLVDWFSPKFVFDAYSGSGAFLVYCKQAGIKCVGIEIDEPKCEAIAKRLSGLSVQLEIFK